MLRTVLLFLLCDLIYVSVDVEALDCPGVTFVTRTQWKSSRKLSVGRIKLPVSRVFIHHTTGASCSSTSACSSKVRSFQNHHVNTNKWSDIGYNFLIGGDGKVYIGRDWDRVGAHTKGYNNDIAISFIGDFSTKGPSAAMMNAAKKLISCGVSKKKIKSNYSLYGHRDAGCTACPGNSLYKAIKKWPRFHAGGKILNLNEKIRHRLAED